MILNTMLSILDKVVMVVASAVIIGFLGLMLVATVYAVVGLGEFIYNKMRGRK